MSKKIENKKAKERMRKKKLITDKRKENYSCRDCNITFISFSKAVWCC
jgi:hypothetical protein